jgi:hypothetical protein
MAWCLIRQRGKFAFYCLVVNVFKVAPWWSLPWRTVETWARRPQYRGEFRLFCLLPDKVADILLPRDNGFIRFMTLFSRNSRCSAASRFKSCSRMTGVIYIAVCYAQVPRRQRFGPRCYHHHYHCYLKELTRGSLPEKWETWLRFLAVAS